MAKAAAKTDFSMTIERVIGAPRERVYRAWTDPAEVMVWWNAGGMKTEIAELDVRVGGAFRLAMRSEEGALYVVVGTFLEVDPPARLVHSWIWQENGPNPGEETVVTIEFRAEGAKTRIVLTHDRFSAKETADDHTAGWRVKLEALGAYFAKTSA